MEELISVCVSGMIEEGVATGAVQEEISKKIDRTEEVSANNLALFLNADIMRIDNIL